MTWLQLSGRGLSLDRLALRSPSAILASGKPRPRSTTGKRAAPSSLSRFQGVAIAPCLGACKAAEAMRDQRFLARKAPQLPLKGCDASKCSCSYRKYRDRRHAEDRRFSLGAFGDLRMGGQGERRDVRERRAR